MTTYALYLADGRRKFINASTSDRAVAYCERKYGKVSAWDVCTKVPLNVEIENVCEPRPVYAATS